MDNFIRKLHEDYTSYWIDGESNPEGGYFMSYFAGSEFWYDGDGVFHRDGGPAFTNYNCRRWYKHGKLHREDGPAMEYADGNKEWWENGVKRFK